MNNAAGRSRRMKRRLLNLLTALSLLLCLAMAALWARGYHAVDGVLVARESGAVEHGARHDLRAISGRGVVALMCEAESWDTRGMSRHRRPARLPRFAYFRMDPGNLTVVRSTPWQRAGFNYLDSTIGTAPTWSRRTRGVRVPHWLLLAACGLAPAVWTVRRLRAGGRAAAGLCRRCGYDLRATPGRCPECGTIAQAASPSPPAP